MNEATYVHRDGPDMLSIDEVVRLTSIGRSTLYKLIASGRLIARKVGRRTFILRRDLDAFMTELPSVRHQH